MADSSFSHALSHAATPLAWSRRAWLAHTTTALALGTPRRAGRPVHPAPPDAHPAAQLAAQAAPVDPAPWQGIAQQGVDAARTAGAHYADVRLTRTCGQVYMFGGGIHRAYQFAEITGAGVRALVDGAWGFAACPWRTPAAVVTLAQTAVAQARVNARNASGPVELAAAPVVQGTWATPLRIDPFAVPIEEKLDFLVYIQDYGGRYGLTSDAFSGRLALYRQERVLATSEGTLVTQTCYETGAGWDVKSAHESVLRPRAGVALQGLTVTGLGWEHILDADIPGQLRHALARHHEQQQLTQHARPITVGRYTLVCDGATMAALLDRTLGPATQLDRALGYEANASGTSVLTDPLGMVGSYQLAAPVVTVTANRTAPTQLATVQWDAEGVVPEPFTLIQDGVVVDYQTTREQALWLAPYYQRRGLPVRSHGCAAAEDALGVTLQMQPNLALTPGAHAARLDDLIADVAQGLLVTGGDVVQLDQQGRSGLLTGQLREIKNGQVGAVRAGGAVSFDTLDLWKHIVAVGGAATTGTVVAPRGGWMGNGGFIQGMRGVGPHPKGEPPQTTSGTTQAVAAIIPNQPIINPAQKA